MSTGNQTKETRQVRIGKVSAGIQKYFMNLLAIDLAGTSRTPADLIATLQRALDAIKQSSNAKAAWRAVVQTERNVLRETSPVLRPQGAGEEGRGESRSDRAGAGDASRQGHTWQEAEGED